MDTNRPLDRSSVWDGGRFWRDAGILSGPGEEIYGAPVEQTRGKKGSNLEEGGGLTFSYAENIALVWILNWVPIDVPVRVLVELLVWVLSVTSFLLWFPA